MGYYHTSSPENGGNSNRHICPLCGRRVYEKFMRRDMRTSSGVYICANIDKCLQAQKKNEREIEEKKKVSSNKRKQYA